MSFKKRGEKTTKMKKTSKIVEIEKNFLKKLLQLREWREKFLCFSDIP